MPPHRSIAKGLFAALALSASAWAQSYDFVTLAGAAGTAGNNDGAALVARFDDPVALATMPDGSVVIADMNNGAVRELTPTQAVVTLATGMGSPSAVVVIGSDIYVADQGRNTIDRIVPGNPGFVVVAGDGSGATRNGATLLQSEFNGPRALAADNLGNLYVADGGDLLIRKISIASGAISTLADFRGAPGATGTFGISSLAADGQGNLYVGAGFPVGIWVVSATGAITHLAGGTANFSLAADGTGLAAVFGQSNSLQLAYAQGRLTVAEYADAIIRQVTPDGVVTTIGGQPNLGGAQDGVGGSARFVGPLGIAADSAGNLYLADDQTIRKGVPTSAESIPFLDAPVSSAYSVGLGNSFTLYSNAAGPAPITLQWYRDGVAIPGASAVTYTVAAAAAADAGSYSVAATNAAGSITRTSNAAHVSIYSPPDPDFSIVHAVTNGTSLWSIAGGANGRYVAVGTGGGIVVSSDGVTWNHVASGVADWLVGVCYGNGQFVAVGDNGRILLSPDGLAWSAAASSGTTNRLNNVLYANGRYVAVGEAGTIVTSTDGSTWQAEPSGVTTWLRGLTYDSNTVAVGSVQGTDYLKRWVATGQSGVLLQSTDGLSWTQVSLKVAASTGPTPLTDDLEAVAGIGTNSIDAVGQSGVIVSGDLLATLEGKWVTGPSYWYWNWSVNPVITETSNRLRGMAQANSALYAFGENGTLLAAASAQGPFANLTSGTSVNLNGGAAIGNSVFVVGDNETILQSSPLPASRLLNISTLAPTSPSSPLAAGFVVQGTAPKQMLVRAAGPALAAFGVANPLADPVLTLYDSNARVIGTNAGWSSQADANAVSAAFASTYAFPFPSGSADSALLVTLNPGLYSAQAQSASGASGAALIEVYDADPATASPSKAVNISSRALVAPKSVLSAGFVIGGNAAHRVLIRGDGPALAGFGVANPLAKPHLAVYQGSSTILATADAWYAQANAAEIGTESSLVGAFALPDTSADAAMVITLNPGAYTVQVSSGDGTSGVALVEVYDLP